MTSFNGQVYWPSVKLIDMFWKVCDHFADNFWTRISLSYFFCFRSRQLICVKMWLTIWAIVKQRTSREGIKWPLTLLKEVKRKEYNHCCQNWICSLHQRIVGACCYEMLHFMMSTDFMSLWLRLHFFLDSLFNQLWDFFLVILSFFHLWGNQNRFKMFDKFLVKS